MRILENLRRPLKPDGPGPPSPSPAQHASQTCLSISLIQKKKKLSATNIIERETILMATPFFLQANCGFPREKVFKFAHRYNESMEIYLSGPGLEHESADSFALHT